MDNLSVLERSKRMAKIRSKDTVPELMVRKITFGMGYRYRLHARDLPGRPDIVFLSRKKVIFVHGCFWHGHEGCKVANRPKSHAEYWDAKFARNKARDVRNEAELRARGWDILIVWECEIKNKAILAKRIQDFLGPTRKSKNAKAC